VNTVHYHNIIHTLLQKASPKRQPNAPTPTNPPSSRALLPIPTLTSRTRTPLLHLRPPRIKHIPPLLNGAPLLIALAPALPERAGLQLALHGDRPVAAKALAHVDHAFFALCVAFLQLLALGGECVFEGRAETVAGGVALEHDAVAVLEAEGEGGT